MTPFTLTLADVKAKGLEAYRAGRLSAQSYDPVCAYRNSLGCPCVVGAALPDTLVDRLIERGRNTYGVYNLRAHGDVKIALEEREAIRRLQAIHDRWARLKSRLIKAGYTDYADQGLQGLTTTEVEALLVKELSA